VIVIVTVAVMVAVAGPVIVAVHVHGNTPVVVIERVKGIGELSGAAAGAR
jgi:dihydroxyacetone kinase-like predicted kinase